MWSYSVNMMKTSKENWRKSKVEKNGKGSRSINLVISGILLLSFSITVLIQSNIGQFQKGIAYAALLIYIVFTIYVLLPRDAGFLSNKWVYLGVDTFAFMAWYFSFALKWINNIIGKEDVGQTMASIMGIIWLLSIVTILTSAMLNAAKGHKQPIKWIHWIIPLILVIKPLELCWSGQYWPGGAMLVFVAISILVSVKEVRDFPIYDSQQSGDKHEDRKS